jgi:hypothetical protein
VSHHADRDTADHVDHQNEYAGRRIAANELAGTVHRAVEVSFRSHFGAARSRFVLSDQPGIQVGIDRHLLARHRVQREACADFRDATRTLGDDDEVDDGQNDEDDDTDSVVAADHELAERFDDFARCVRAGVPVKQHDTSGRNVQCETQQCREQQHSREDAEVERPHYIEDRHYDDQRQSNVEREQHVQRDRRQRDDDHRKDGQYADRHTEAGAQQRAQIESCL